MPHNPPYVVDGLESDDPDAPYMGDGQYPPFRVFEVDAQQYVGLPYSTREAAQAEADRLNGFRTITIDGTVERPITLDQLNASPCFSYLRETEEEEPTPPMFREDYDGNDFKVDELKAGIRWLQTELATRDAE